MWKHESKQVKAHYGQLAKEADREHKAKHPGYKYAPRVKRKELQHEMAECVQQNAKYSAECEGEMDVDFMVDEEVF